MKFVQFLIISLLLEVIFRSISRLSFSMVQQNKIRQFRHRFYWLDSLATHASEACASATYAAFASLLHRR